MKNSMSFLMRRGFSFLIVISLLCLVCINLVFAKYKPGKFEPEFQIGFLTDIEGKWGYLESYIHKKDSVLLLKPDGEIELKENTYFVFGGDVPDKGPNSLQLVHSLVRLKEKYPERVFLILGNRDINKLRLKFELSDIAIQEKVVYHTFHQLWAEWIGKRNLNPETDFNRANLMKFIGEKTMGGDQIFEYRKEEIAKVNRISLGQIKDEDVALSFLEEIGEPIRGRVLPSAFQGDLRKFLEMGQLGLILGNTLFIHGALTPENYGVVPGIGKTNFKNIEDWIDELNQIKDKSLKDWASAKPSLNYLNGKEKYPSEDFIAYASPAPGMKSAYPSIVIKRQADPETGRFIFPSFELSEKLIQQGIYRIVVGHTPGGWAPLIIKNDKIEFINGDNSDSRSGLIAPSILIGQNSVHIVTQVEGEEIDFHLDLDRSKMDPFIGKRLADENFFIIGRVKGKDKYLLFKQIIPGFGPAKDFKSGNELRKLQVNGKIHSDDEERHRVLSHGK